jgi:N-acetylglucosamine kinase-like BadF-type ATPase
MIVLGIDGGGTKTHALALDERGQLVGYGVGGASGYHSLGLEAAMAVIAEVAAQALGGRQADFVACCLACCDSEADERLLSAGLATLEIAPSLLCCNDAFAPLRAGSRRPYGVAVICGTGFNACGIAPDGRTAKLASLGELTGDWGGGYDVAAAGLGAVYRADDGRGPLTAMRDAFLHALGVPSLDVLAERIVAHGWNRWQIGKLAPLVYQFAEAGDAVARAILVQLGDEIVVAASAMLRRLDMADLEVDVVLSGGLMQGPVLISHVVEQLGQRHPRAAVRQVDVPPVVGAALLGYDALRVAAPDPRQISLPAQLVKASLPA